MALKNLFDNYVEFEEIIDYENEGIIDLDGVELNPTTVLPLLCECRNQNLKIFNDDAFGYLENKLNRVLDLLKEI